MTDKQVREVVDGVRTLKDEILRMLREDLARECNRIPREIRDALDSIGEKEIRSLIREAIEKQIGITVSVKGLE